MSHENARHENMLLFCAHICHLQITQYKKTSETFCQEKKKSHLKDFSRDPVAKTL